MERTDVFSVEVLGAAGGYPYQGHACSGFLVNAGSDRILMDCGPGVGLRLLDRMRASDLTGIVLTHIHPDHVLDLITVGYALMTEWVFLKRNKPVPVLLPIGGLDFLKRFSALFGHKHWQASNVDAGIGYDAIRDAVTANEDWMFTVFDAREYTTGDDILIGDTTLNSLPVDHMPGASALRVDFAGKRLVYSGDTRWLPELIPFATDADILIAEGHFSGSHPPGGAHMTPKQAGQLASGANAKQLVLTHIAAPEDGANALEQVKQTYNGPVCLAIETEKLELL